MGRSWKRCLMILWFTLALFACQALQKNKKITSLDLQLPCALFSGDVENILTSDNQVFDRYVVVDTVFDM